MATAEVRKKGFPVFIKQEAKLLDANNSRDLNEAAHFLANGEVVIFPICGVMGLICDASQERGPNRIYELKDRDRQQQLITAGSASTRDRLLIDYNKLDPDWKDFDFSSVYDLPVFLIFPSQEGLSRDFVRPDVDGTDAVAIWWANRYNSINELELRLQQLRPESYIGGTSCNRTKQESLTTSGQAFGQFGKGSERVAAVVYYRPFDQGRCLIDGSHTMMRVRGKKIVPVRSGSTHTDSFKTLLGEKLEVPEDFQNLPTAAILDIDQIRQTGHYLKPVPREDLMQRFTHLLHPQ